MISKITNILIVFAAIAIFPYSIAGEEVQYEKINYLSTVDYNNPKFSDENWVYSVKLSGDEEIIFENDFKHIFLIVNGSFVNTKIYIKDNYSLINANILCDYIGAELSKTESNLTIKKDNRNIVIPYGSKKVLTNGIYKLMPIDETIINGAVYVPLRFVCEELGACVTYTQDYIAPFGNPVIDIDFREHKIDERSALAKTKATATECFENMTNSDKYTNKRINADIKKRIDNMTCIGETAGFWIIEGPYIFLTDKTDGTVFVKYGSGSIGHGSYVESIEEVKTSNTDIFGKDYYFG